MSIVNKKIEVINIKKYIANDYIYIGRPSKFGNPYSSKDSDLATIVDTREISLEKFEEYIDDNSEIIDDLISEMIVKNVYKLGCWCKPRKCHGDILMKKINDRRYNSLF